MFEQMMFAVAVIALGLSSLALASTFGTRGVARAHRGLVYKIWGGRSPDEILAKRFKLFVLIGILLIGISKLLYLQGIMPFPNFEMIIPALVVMGSFSLYLGPNKLWRSVNRYFGILAIVSVIIIDLVFWGPRAIYIFTWPGFILIWILAMRNKLSMFDKFKKLLWRTTLTAAIAIIFFDVFTGVVGWSLVYGTGIVAAFLGVIPFAMYHLCSLIFIPPLVGLGKAMVKVKVPVKVAVAAEARVGVQKRG